MCSSSISASEEDPFDLENICKDSRQWAVLKGALIKAGTSFSMADRKRRGPLLQPGSEKRGWLRANGWFRGNQNFDPELLMHMQATVASGRHGDADHRKLAAGLRSRKMDLHVNSEKDIRRWVLNIVWFLAEHLHSVLGGWR